MAATAAGDNRDLRPARGGHAIEVLPTPGNALPEVDEEARGNSIAPAAALSVRAAPARSKRLEAGLISYANRLMFNRCRGEMLSEVMLPPYPPHPRVIAGSSPVVAPTSERHV